MNIIVNDILNDTPSILGLSKWLVQFEDIDLTSLCSSSAWYMIKNWNSLSLDNIEITEFVSNLVDWWSVINKKYWNKKVSFALYIQGLDHNDLIEKINSLKKLTQKENWSFYITYWWVSYKYTATLTSIQIPNFSTLDDFIDEIVLEFLFTSPHWQVEEPIVFNWTYTDDFQKIVNNSWNYKTYGKFILVWKTWNNITNINLEIKAPWEVSWLSTNFDLTFWVDDVVIIDYNEKTITLNWTELVFTWYMVPFETWNNVINFSFIWDVNLDTYILYNKILL